MLADSGLKYRVLDARPPASNGAPDRTLALSYNTRLLFERLGVWRRLGRVTPIEEIDVSQKGGFGVTRLSARDVDLPALGYVIHYADLQRVLDRALEERGVNVARGQRVERVTSSGTEATVEISAANSAPPDASAARLSADAASGSNQQQAKLVAIADGTGDIVPELRRRKIDYRQRALIGHVECDRMPGGVAFERFTPDGPVALLPDESGYALVWTARPERATLLGVQEDADFLDALQHHFGDRVGRFTSIRERNVFPLSLQFASAVRGRRWVVLGNAAQALHPIAGQGFNLGLRDVWAFAETLRDCADNDIGESRCLDTYADARRTDRWAGMLMTHGLVGIFATELSVVSAARGLGLTLLDSIPPLKRALTRAMQNGLR